MQYSLAENFFWLHDITTTFAIFHLLMISPDWSMHATQSEWHWKERACFWGYTQGHLSRVHLHYMRYECIALCFGCSGFAVTPRGLDSCLPGGFPPAWSHLFLSPMSFTRITWLYSYYQHPKTLWWRDPQGKVVAISTAHYHYPASRYPSAMTIHPSPINLASSWGLKKVHLNLHPCTYYNNQIQNLECIYSPLPTPFLFLFTDNKP